MIAPSRSALALIAGVLAAGLVPPVKVAPSTWAKQNLVVPDGPRAGEKWDASLTPYAIEVLDALSPDTDINEIAVRKSAQTGLTTVMIAWQGCCIDTAPCKMMTVLPTIDALQEFNREKLNPAIEQTKVLKEKVFPQTSRSSGGSTSFSKRFKGGSLVLANANSASDLSSKTIKYIGCDEVDRWPDELDGQGDPMELVEARYMSFRATKDWKKFQISTPTVKGNSRIDDAFENGDQRYWHVTCPGCGERFYFEFKYLKFERQKPYKAHYVAQCCGTIIEPHERRGLVLEGSFIATEPGEYKPRSYHVDTLVSLLVNWDDIAEKWWYAQGDEKKLKAFYNLWLGLAYQVRGDAPDWERLMERREDYSPGIIPPGALIITGMADVQANGIYFEAVGWGPQQRSWVIDAQFLEGDTTDANAGAFAALARIVERTFPDAYGNQRGFDAFGVDSGYQANVVYTFVRSRPNVFALKGMPGWFLPALGTATPVDINYKGKKTRHGATVWPVGNYNLKASFYAHLRKGGIQSGALEDPVGFCHFGGFLDETYFRQITSEYLATEKKNGVSRRVWKESGANHFLDCRIGNMAMCEAPHIRMSTLTADDWAKIARDRGVPDSDVLDLFTPVLAPAETQPTPDSPSAPVAAPTKPKPRFNAGLAALSKLNG